MLLAVNICFLSGARIERLINFSNIVPIMLALCLMLLVTYYALNYAGIIGQCLIWCDFLFLKILPLKGGFVRTIVW